MLLEMRGALRGGQEGVSSELRNEKGGKSAMSDPISLVEGLGAAMSRRAEGRGQSILM